MDAEGEYAQVPTKCFKTAPRDDCELESLLIIADAQARESETVSDSLLSKSSHNTGTWLPDYDLSPLQTIKITFLEDLQVSTSVPPLLSPNKTAQVDRTSLILFL
jgi:hypothetical protein